MKTKWEYSENGSAFQVCDTTGTFICDCVSEDIAREIVARHNVQDIEQQNMFHTPKTWNELEAWIQAHNSEDRIHLYTAAMMAWNLAASCTNPEIYNAKWADEEGRP